MGSRNAMLHVNVCILYLTLLQFNCQGPCVLGECCKHKDHELRLEHRCHGCRNCLHVLCADHCDPEDDRIIYCGLCKHSKKKPELEEDEEETETEEEEEEERTKPTVVSNSNSNDGNGLDTADTIVVPKEVTKNRTISNCLISTITQSVDGNPRYIPKDFFYRADQRINTDYKNKYKKDWLAMRDEIEKEIDEDLKLRMVRRAQQVGLSLNSNLVTSIKEIGQAFSNDDSIECATKINTILNEDFRIRSGYERTIESIIMKKLNIVYTDQESTAKGCVARMVVKRKCNIAKVINKRVDRTHQGKVHIKRTQDEVAALLLKDSEQAFAVGTSGWFTSDGKQYEPTGKIVSKRSHFYMNKIAKLESELKKKEDIMISFSRKM